MASVFLKIVVDVPVTPEAIAAWVEDSLNVDLVTRRDVHVSELDLLDSYLGEVSVYQILRG